jgi:phosphoribosylaminoimidazolecarboxamide formyltransferase/IMP cyclohydrolase
VTQHQHLVVYWLQTQNRCCNAIEINKLFCRSSYCSWCRRNIEILQQKKKTNYFNSKRSRLTTKQVRSCLNGLLIQERNNITDNKDLKTVTVTSPTEQEIQDLIFASKVCKTQNLTRSFCKNGTLISSELVKLQELMPYFKIEKQNLWFWFKRTVMASDAFPFPDCVAIAKRLV